MATWYKKSFFLLLLLILCLGAFSYNALPVLGQEEEAEEVSEEVEEPENTEVEEIRTRMQENNQRIEELEEEIRKYEEELEDINSEKRTLQGTVREIDVSRNKIQVNIRVTENRIEGAQQEIQRLAREVDTQQSRIERDQEAVAEALRRMNQLDEQTLIESLLKHESLTEFWEQVDMVQQFESSLRSNVRNLLILSRELEDTIGDREVKVDEFEDLRGQLSGEKAVLDNARQEKNQLLEVTKNEESKYQEILADKREARERLEAELRSLESELQFALDPSSIPTSGSGALSWPFSLEYMGRCGDYESALGNPYCVTQLFGNTTFAKSGGYAGKGHNGIDFRASIGSKVRSALSGRVRATGNTDSIRGCYSYGKWVLVEHQNGLTTLYAHLSHISVSPSQAVRTGDIVGFSGNTGYSTGPHLHFSVFASEGVRVADLGAWYRENGRAPTTACSKGGAIIPVAAYNAYLNPLDFLL